MHLTTFSFQKKCVSLFAVVSLLSLIVFSQDSKAGGKASHSEEYPAINVEIASYLSPLRDSSGVAKYRLALCADVPNNKRPLQVAYHQESGHVFLVLQKIVPGTDTLHRVFGFYPRRGLPTLFFKTISSRIKDNSYREYDVEVSLDITAQHFDTIMAMAVDLAARKYHINKFNCYDYALRIFNAVAGDSTLPAVYVRFPFIFGRGGSPCSVYKDLTRLQSSVFWGSRIRFGVMRAPVSTHVR